MYRLGLHFGEEGAVRQAQSEALNREWSVESRIQALQGLALARSPSSVEALLRALRARRNLTVPARMVNSR